MPKNIIGLIAQNLSKKGFWLAAHNRGAPRFNALEQRLYKELSTENKLNPIHFLIYYNVQFA